MDFERLSKCICSVAQLSASTPQCCYNESQKLASRWQAELKRQGDLGALHHFIWVVETEKWGILQQLQMPFTLAASLQRPQRTHRGSLKRSARAVQLFARLAVLETHALRS